MECHQYPASNQEINTMEPQRLRKRRILYLKMNDCRHLPCSSSAAAGSGAAAAALRASWALRRHNNFVAILILFLVSWLGLFSSPVQGQLPLPPAGFLDFDNLPVTRFSCEGKVIGGYYADVETGCQMFHVCTLGQKDTDSSHETKRIVDKSVEDEVQDIKFLCLNGTVFDQETRVCERVDEVDCSKAEQFYDLNLDLYLPHATTPKPEESHPQPSAVAPTTPSTTTSTTTTTTTSTTTTTTSTSTTTTTPRPRPRPLPTSPPSSSSPVGAANVNINPKSNPNNKGYSSFYYHQTPTSLISSGYNSQHRPSSFFVQQHRHLHPQNNQARKVPSGPKTILFQSSSTPSPQISNPLRRAPSSTTTTTTTTPAPPPSQSQIHQQQHEPPAYTDEYYDDEDAEGDYAVSSSTTDRQQQQQQLQQQEQLQQQRQEQLQQQRQEQLQQQRQEQLQQQRQEQLQQQRQQQQSNSNSNNVRIQIKSPTSTQYRNSQRTDVNHGSPSSSSSSSSGVSNNRDSKKVQSQYIKPTTLPSAYNPKSTPSSSSSRASNNVDNISSSTPNNSNKLLAGAENTNSTEEPYYYEDDYENENAEYYDDSDNINTHDHHFSHVDVPRIPFAKPNVPRVLVTNGKPFLPRLRRQSHHHNFTAVFASGGAAPPVVKVRDSRGAVPPSLGGAVEHLEYYPHRSSSFSWPRHIASVT